MSVLQECRKVVLINFYDRTCVSTRILYSILKGAGHEPYLIIFKDDRITVIDSFKKDNLYYQTIFHNEFNGCGEDVNPPTEREIDILIKKMVEINPDVIGISARSVAKDISKRIVSKLRKVLPKVRYIGGGYGPTVEPEKFLEFLDFVCLGEGDECILGMVISKDPREVNNVAWLENGKLLYNKLAKGVNLNEAAYPNWDLDNKYMVEDNAIKSFEDVYDITAYDIFASRGCPAGCTYCMASHWNDMYGKYGAGISGIRLRSPESVIDELLIAKEKYNLGFVRFKDSIFGFNEKWFYKFMDLYDEEIGLKFFCYLDERFIDEDRIKRLVSSGLDRTVVGIQSANEKIRKDIMKRNISDDGLVEYANLVVKYGMRLQYDIIGWNPFEDNNTLREGTKFLKRLPKGDLTGMFQLKVFHGSRLDSMIKERTPKPLSNKDYEYWAWIYQMILRSKETEEMADFIMKYTYFKEHPRLLKSLFSEALGKLSIRDKLFAARDIDRGGIITQVMIEMKRTDKKGGICVEEVRSVEGRTACKSIIKGKMLTRDDFYSEYGAYGASIQ